MSHPATLDRPEAIQVANQIYQDFLDHMAQKSESYKFIRMADDMHDIAGYLSEMRVCFIILTVTVYIVLAILIIKWCMHRSHRQANATGTARGRTPNNRFDYQTTDEYQNATTTGQTNTDELTAVRSDGQIGLGMGNKSTPSYMGRNHRNQVPSFMRHGMHMNHHQGGTTYGGAASASAQDTRNSPSTRLIGATTGSNDVSQAEALPNKQPPTHTTAGVHSHTSAFHAHHQPHIHHHPIPHIVTTAETTTTNTNGSPTEDTIIGPIGTSTPTTITTSASGTPQTAMVSLRHHNRNTGLMSSERQEITATEM